MKWDRVVCSQEMAEREVCSIERGLGDHWPPAGLGLISQPRNLQLATGFLV